MISGLQTGKIIGIGIDMVSMERIGRSISRHPARFKDKVFTQTEQAYCESKGEASIGSYAKRWAAKEACAKALGTGMAKGVSFQDIEVINQDFSAPSLFLKGGALDRLNDLLPENCDAEIHVSLSDDKPWAQAMVIISATQKVEL